MWRDTTRRMWPLDAEETGSTNSAQSRRKEKTGVGWGSISPLRSITELRDVSCLSILHLRVKLGGITSLLGIS